MQMFSGFHALIVEGEYSDGGRNHAKRSAAARLCDSPAERPCMRCPQCRKVMDEAHLDVAMLDLGQGKEITVDKIRAIRSDSFIRPYEQGDKIYAILRAENLNSHAQNALLKLLEEPPPYAVFFLYASSAASLLPTIRSRCVIARASAATAEEEPPEAIERGRELYMALKKGDELALARALWSWDKLPRAELAAALRVFCMALREGMGQGFPLDKAVKAIDKTYEILRALDGNAAVGICCAALCAKLAALL